jgi:Arc/MetJ family transcription regulator
VSFVYTPGMKHLIDLDEQALASARAALGTSTIKATVNEALRRAAIDSGRETRIRSSLDALASMPVFDRADAWR